MAQGSGTVLAYVGTYTRNGSKGIYCYRVDTETGALTLLGTTNGVQNPSFVALHPGGRFLYSVSEVGASDGRPGGAVAAFALDPVSGALTLLNQQSSMGSGPCHVNVDHTGRYVFVANYGSGSAAMLPIQEDGSLGPACDSHQHEGSSVVPRRQEGPHAHSANLAPDNRFVFVCDLGLDRVLAYRLDLDGAKFPPNDPAWGTLHPGAGPRHMTFHPSGEYAYVINELDSTMTVFAYDGARGALETIQTITTLPEGFEGTSYPADVHISQDGRFLYGSNRGHDSIVTYAVDAATGKLTVVGHTSTFGEFPRNFNIDPTGRWMYVANQNTNNIVTYRIDAASGMPEPTGEQLEVPIPVCIQFLTV
jgi:6-phosphogluconolactonase